MAPVTVNPVTMAVVGVGNRGSVYSTFALENPERLKVVAAVDPNASRLEHFAKAHGIPKDKCFEDWPELAAQAKLADFVLIATPDRQHKAPALAVAALGYHILLEKPMAVSEEDCVEIVEAAEKNKIMLAVCHVLRYAPMVQKINELIKSGRIGDVVSIVHTEPVGYWHFAHSFVRGNWSNKERSTFGLMSKCCHDIDLLTYWMEGVKVTKVSSFGALRHFNAANKPKGAAERCLDCPVAATCPYDASRLYIGMAKRGETGWPVEVVSSDPTVESVTNALREGRYGQCVYQLDNDVVDNQVVMLQYENGTTATMVMAATTEELCVRTTKVYGSLGEITCTNADEVFFFDFVTNKKEVYDTMPKLNGSKMTAHGGADYYLMDRFVRAVAENDPSQILTTPRATLLSHRLVFAGERARQKSEVISVGLDW